MAWNNRTRSTPPVTHRQRGSALIGATMLSAAALTATMMLQSKTAYHAKSQTRANLQHGLIGLTKSALETTEQLINAEDTSGLPFFRVELNGADFIVAPTLSPYLSQVYRFHGVHQFMFRHCASQEPAIAQGVYSVASNLPGGQGCNTWIETTVAIRKITDKYVIAKATSVIPHRGQNLSYQLTAKLLRTHIPMANCPWVDPSDFTKLHPNYVGEIPNLLSYNKTMTVWTARYLSTQFYDAVNNTVNFEFWTFHEENNGDHKSTYRWDQFYSAFPATVGNVTTHLMAGPTDTPADYVRNLPGFVRGNWIWNGGWNVKRKIAINNPNGACTLTRTSISGSPPGQRNGGCFAESTQIRLANGKDISIKDLRVGDRVYNPVSKKPALVYGVVAGPESKPMLEIGVGSSTVLVTDEHPMWTRRGLIPASSLQDDDQLYCEQATWCSIKGLRWQQANSSTTVYNVNLMANSNDPRDHFLLADGIPAGDLHLQQRLKSGHGDDISEKLRTSGEQP